MPKYAKLRALGSIVERQLAEQHDIRVCYGYLELENDLLVYGDGQNRLNSLKDCFDTLCRPKASESRGRSTDTTLPQTQWNNLEIGWWSSTLYRTLHRMINSSVSRGLCPGHRAYLRLNGFELEKPAPTSFELYLSICERADSWLEGKFISLLG